MATTNAESKVYGRPWFSSCYSVFHKVPCWARCCLYVLYTAELSHGLCFQQYADDSQIYISTTIDEAALAVQRFTACVTAISDWMSAIAG